MKTLIFLFSILLFPNNLEIEKYNNFDSELSWIASELRSNIMDKDECENLQAKTDDLVTEIEDAIEDEDEYTEEDIIKFEKLKKEAEALEDYIAVVGNCGNYSLSMDDFHLANQRIGGDVVSVSKDIYCVDVIMITIGEYVTYLGHNNSRKNFTVAYNWKTSTGMNSGNGTMGLTGMSVRHIYDNRENPELVDIEVYGVSCVEF